METCQKYKIALVGSGPAALMCASALCLRKDVEVSLFEQYQTLARKLLIAGKSGLNVTNSCTKAKMVQRYRGPKKHFKDILNHFSAERWVKFLNDLGVETFVGSSGHVLLKDKTASNLVNKWIIHLKNEGLLFFLDHALSDFSLSDKKVELEFNHKTKVYFDAVVLALGGQSYLSLPSDWVDVFKKKKISFTEFEASNVGYEVQWSPGFLKEAEGSALKNIILKNKNGECAGELLITKYGLEGTPVYTLGQRGIAFIDLKPGLSKEDIVSRVQKNPKKISAFRLLVKQLHLNNTAQALLYHETSDEIKINRDLLIERIKNFPIELIGPRPLLEAISTRGGVRFSNCDENLMLKEFPGVFLAGEMLDWDAPTGGFLIQACVSQGAWVAKSLC